MVIRTEKSVMTTAGIINLMKTITKKTNTVGIILDFMWGSLVLVGTTYLVFFKGINPWWYLLALLLMSASFLTEKIEVIE